MTSRTLALVREPQDARPDLHPVDPELAPWQAQLLEEWPAERYAAATGGSLSYLRQKRENYPRLYVESIHRAQNAERRARASLEHAKAILPVEASLYRAMNQPERAREVEANLTAIEFDPSLAEEVCKRVNRRSSHLARSVTRHVLRRSTRARLRWSGVLRVTRGPRVRSRESHRQARPTRGPPADEDPAEPPSSTRPLRRWERLSRLWTLRTARRRFRELREGVAR